MSVEQPVDLLPRMAKPPKRGTDGGTLKSTLKSTSIAAIVGFVELTRAGQLMTNTTFKPMIIYPLVAVLYFREDGERRADTGDGSRTVRVGTHALCQRLPRGID